MTIKRAVELECPKCGVNSETVVWDSLNVSLDPEAKDELLAGRLNRFHCHACDYETTVAVDLLYHDMGREYLVQLYPFQNMEDEDFFTGFTVSGQPDFSRAGLEHAADYFKNVHVVFGIDELVRYVIFRDRLYEHYNRVADKDG
jgi:hypothetical protein